jgi:hypothetical protein
MKRLIKFFTNLFSKKQEGPVREPMFTPEEGINVNYILESPERLQELMTYQADPTLREHSKFKVTKETVVESETAKLKKAVTDAWDGICLSRVTSEAQIEMANIAKADIQRQIDTNNKIQQDIFGKNKTENK